MNVSQEANTFSNHSCLYVWLLSLSPIQIVPDVFSLVSLKNFYNIELDGLGVSLFRVKVTREDFLLILSFYILGFWYHLGIKISNWDIICKFVVVVSLIVSSLYIKSAGWDQGHSHVAYRVYIDKAVG